LGQIDKRLLDEAHKEAFEILFAVASNITFLAIIGLILWPVHKATLAFRFAYAYPIFWVVTFLTSALVNWIQRLFRVNIYDHSNAFVISNLAVSCLLQLAWSLFAAVAVYRTIAGASTFAILMLYLVGGLSCLVSYFVVSSFYQGAVYRLISLPLALLSFVGFSIACLKYAR
jgi:hypothetical protein